MANVRTDFRAIGLVIGAFKSARRDAIADLEYGGGMIHWRDGLAKRINGRCLSLGTPSSERLKVEFGRLASARPASARPAYESWTASDRSCR